MKNTNRTAANDELNLMIMSSSVHEIKNIFFRMQLNFENLADDLKNQPESIRKMNRISMDFHAIENQLNQLLLSYKSSQNEIAMHCEDVELNAFLKSFMERHRIPLESLGVHIEILNSEDCESFVDEHLLQNVLDTLVFNSISVHAKHLKIAVQGTAKNPALHFMDNGPGFPADFLATSQNDLHIRPHDITQHRFGLGLYFAHQILKLMHSNTSEQTFMQFSNGNALSKTGGTITIHLPSAGWVGLV
ncbi:MAG: ATP-binding protein [Pseudomonadota bacterium]